MGPALLVFGVVGVGLVVAASSRRRSTSAGKLPGVESKAPGDLYGPFRERLDRLLGDLHAAGFKPRIRATWRSPERQAAYKASGWSKVDRSFHEVTGPDGARESLAADVYDARWGPDDPRQAPFYRALLSRSGAHGLTTGGAWTSAKWPNDPAKALGWDPGHVEPDSNVSIDEAHDGERPWTL